MFCVLCRQRDGFFWGALSEQDGWVTHLVDAHVYQLLVLPVTEDGQTTGEVRTVINPKLPVMMNPGIALKPVDLRLR
jgi:hypothetical protein